MKNKLSLPFGWRFINLRVTCLVLISIKFTVLSVDPVAIYYPSLENATEHTKYLLISYTLIYTKVCMYIIKLVQNFSGFNINQI